MSGYRYLAAEDAISRRLGLAPEHPVPLFDVEPLGVSFDERREAVGPSFHDLGEFSRWLRIVSHQMGVVARASRKVTDKCTEYLRHGDCVRNILGFDVHVD